MVDILDFLKRRRVLARLADDGAVARIAEIDRVICAVDNPFYRDLLIRHYVRCQTVRRIASELHYSPRHVKRLLVRARAAAEKLKELSI